MPRPIVHDFKAEVNSQFPARVDAMTGSESRPLRADAQRNRDRIMEAARRVLTEQGPHLPLEEIARLADVSPATLYRHFANREELLIAVVERRFGDEVEPVIATALTSSDPWAGLVEVVGATLSSGTISPAWRETISLVREDAVAREFAREQFLVPAGELLRRAQAAGVARADVDPADLTPIMRMLRALVTTHDDYEAGAWRRYLALMLRATH
jgi:AcrR family transcriptional regulator